MLRHCSEEVQLLPAKTQEDAARRLADGKAGGDYLMSFDVSAGAVR